MFAFVLCLFVLLASASLAQPIERETKEPPTAVEQPLCSAVRAAANTTQLEEATGLLEPVITALGAEPQVPNEGRGKLPPAERLKLVEERKLFETSLVNWRFFEDLAPRQRAMVQSVLVRCGSTEGWSSVAASVFGQWNASERATFVGITHAL